jgi:hypothetical protein
MPPGLGTFQHKTGATKMGFVFKMSRHGEFTYYLTIRGNIIEYIAFCCNNLSFLVYLQYQHFKKMFKCVPLSPLLYVITKVRIAFPTLKTEYLPYSLCQSMPAHRK